ncbi:lysophospholipase [Neolewinella aurantiaca]|uniref:Lysophospholipase n=1 Tax=Neolewinella aurantiaca TaxID=2602767 RepID=A0A5C7FFP8_9BACT|nr:alpha/beta fold hydrolase [Neolewinella aurantiaca]TXF85039.1 lysophospholipase [Neolewinella aurantiaca]
MKKWLKRIAIFFGVLYLVLAVVIYVKQEALIFHPRAHAEDYSYGDYPEIWITTPDGTRLHGLHLRNGGKGVILYLHGNVGDNGRSLRQTRSLQDLGYDLFLVDYRGFGKSEGSLNSEADMTEDLQAVYDHLKTEFNENQIIVTGYSLGSGPASYLAANNKPEAVVLVAPYTSLMDMKNLFFWVFPDFLMKYELDNRANLARATSPVYILHGTDDELIPLEMGQELEALDPDRIKLVELNGVGHRGAILNSMFRAVVSESLRN